MGRILRTATEATWHHVMNRGARRLDIFGDDDDRSFFLRQVGDAAQPAEVAIHAFVLMSNHYHLLVEAPTMSLSAAMKAIGENYTRRFNRKYGLDGPLFRGRYRSRPIADGAYLQTVVRYIHRNPLEAGVGTLDHPWSSHRSYVGGASSPSWLTVGDVLHMFGSRSAYRQFVETTVNGEPGATFAERPTQVPRGGFRAVEWALGLASPAELDLLRSRAGVRNDLRAAAVLLCMESTDCSAAQLADRYGFSSGSAVRTAASRARARLTTDAGFARLISDARARLDQGGQAA